MVAAPKHSVSVAATIVDNQGRVLVIKRADNGHWEPPGGVLELDEDIETGLRREVREETGLEIENPTLTGVYKNLERGIVALVFRAHATEGAITMSDETTSWTWLTAGELDQRVEPAYAIRLHDALRGGPPAIRAHDGQHIIDTPNRDA